jgi:hypothetical protein
MEDLFTGNLIFNIFNPLGANISTILCCLLPLHTDLFLGYDDWGSCWSDSWSQHRRLCYLIKLMFTTSMAVIIRNI